MSSISAWILASRPKTLFAGISPVAIGTAVAHAEGRFALGPMVAALVGALSIQIGTNFCNDYFDHFQGADTEARKGPTRAVAAGLISPTRMALATAAMFGVTLLVSCYLGQHAGWAFLLIGIMSIVCGVMYTAGRWSLAYLGLGDPFVLVFFGPVAVAGTYYVQALTLNLAIVVAGLAPGLMAVGLLVSSIIYATWTKIEWRTNARWPFASESPGAVSSTRFVWLERHSFPTCCLSWGIPVAFCSER